MGYPRAELEHMVERWLAVNRQAQHQRDWRPLADLYTEDASYGWNLGPHEEFMAVGREEIRQYALGTEMAGLESWRYPYVRVLIDDVAGEVVGFWRQLSDVDGPEGEPYEVPGIGGSWFRYGGNGLWSWQRDFFDLGNVTALFVDMIKADALSEGMRRRMEAASRGLPGHFPLGDGPAPIWP